MSRGAEWRPAVDKLAVNLSVELFRAKALIWGTGGKYRQYTTDTCGGRPFLTGVRETPGGSNRKARLQPGFSLTLRHTCWQRHRRCCAEPTVGPPRAELLRKNRMDRKGRCWVEYRYTSGARPLLTAVRAGLFSSPYVIRCDVYTPLSTPSPP